MSSELNPGLLARGPWQTHEVECSWLELPYKAPTPLVEHADQALQALKDRGSPSHDGLAARMSGFTVENGVLDIELQPARWSLRLNEEDSSQCIAALCLTRDAEGRWLAGRRAAWVASWPGRWALGAGGAVEVGEHPVETLARELEEEWSVVPDQLTTEALLLLPSKMAMLVGMAWLPPGAAVTPDDEHDEFEWWPADPAKWPDHADEPLRRMGEFLTS